MMIRCIRLWSGPDGRSHFEEGVIDLEPGPRGDTLSGKFPIASVSFQETNADPKLGWHPDPARQLVITLSGALEFTTHDGRFSLRAGTYCLLRTPSPATIGSCSATNPGGGSTPSLTRLPSFHFGLGRAQPFPAERRAQQKQQLRQEKAHDPMCTNMDGR
jgi:hypothetical protein